MRPRRAAGQWPIDAEHPPDSASGGAVPAGRRATVDRGRVATGGRAVDGRLLSERCRRADPLLALDDGAHNSGGRQLRAGQRRIAVQRDEDLFGAAEPVAEHDPVMQQRSFIQNGPENVFGLVGISVRHGIAAHGVRVDRDALPFGSRRLHHLMSNLGADRAAGRGSRLRRGARRGADHLEVRGRHLRCGTAGHQEFLPNCSGVHGFTSARSSPRIAPQTNRFITSQEATSREPPPAFSRLSNASSPSSPGDLEGGWPAGSYPRPP